MCVDLVLLTRKRGEAFMVAPMRDGRPNQRKRKRGLKESVLLV